MTLSLFLQELYKVCGNGNNQPDFVNTVLQSVFDEENARRFKKEFPFIDESTLNKYFRGERKLSGTNAKLILSNLNKDGLDTYLNDLLTEDARIELCGIFEKHIGNVTSDDITLKLSHLLVEILQTIAYKKTIAEAIDIKPIILDNEVVNKELENIVEKLSSIDPKKFKGLIDNLSYEPQTIDNKIPYTNETNILKNEIKGYVACYFTPIQELFQQPNDCKSTTFTQLEYYIKSRSEKLFAQNKSHKETFDKLAEWVKGITNNDYNACRIVVAFFVQNCEVFTL